MKKYFFILFFLSCLFEIYSQSFTASVNSSKVGLNDSFEISFTFSGKDVNGLSNFQPPDFKNFLTLGGPNQSTSMQIINGAMSASITFSYYLQPRALGKFTIGSAKVKYNGENFSTEAITIEVVQGSSKPQTNQTDNTISSEEIAENLFIRAIPDKREVFQGEQITVTYKLFTRLNISSPQISKLPVYEGFWSEELDGHKNIIFTRETIDGKIFNSAVLKKVALFPQRAGELSVTPFELKIPVLIERKKKTGNIFDTFFDDPFFRTTETYEFTAKTNTVKINVKALPPLTDAAFNGAVGNYSLTTNFDKLQTKQNEPITLKIEISGSGNIKLVQFPEIKLPNGFETYEPKSFENINRGNIINGKKSFEYLLVPRNVGKFELPQLSFTYFDVAKKQFVTLSKGPFEIEVTPGAGNLSSSTTPFSKEEIQWLNEDIRYIKTSSKNLFVKIENVFASPIYWGMSALPFLAFILFVAVKRREIKISKDVILSKTLRAEKIAKQRLKKAAKFLKENSKENFYTEISQALLGYLEDRLLIQKSEFTLQSVIETLHQKNISENLKKEVERIFNHCEYVRYASVADTSFDMKTVFESTSKLIVNLEKEISEKK